MNVRAWFLVGTPVALAALTVAVVHHARAQRYAAYTVRAGMA